MLGRFDSGSSDAMLRASGDLKADSGDNVKELQVYRDRISSLEGQVVQMKAAATATFELPSRPKLCTMCRKDLM